MNEFIEGFRQGIVDTSWLEWIVTLTAILYVILAALKNIWCWPFAFISSAIAVYIFYDSKLYVESFLSVFYVIMAVVGYVMWNKTKNDKAQIIKWDLKWHLINIAASLVLAFLLGYLLQEHTDQEEPYVDSFTTIFALAATFMVSKKVLNNWLYWIVIDAVSIYLYTSRNLELLAVLYFVYTILATYGWIKWKKQYKLQSS